MKNSEKISYNKQSQIMKKKAFKRNLSFIFTLFVPSPTLFHLTLLTMLILFKEAKLCLILLPQKTDLDKLLSMVSRGEKREWKAFKMKFNELNSSEMLFSCLCQFFSLRHSIRPIYKWHEKNEKKLSLLWSNLYE